MQSAFVIITKLIASKSYFCKEVFCNNFGRNNIPHGDDTEQPYSSRFHSHASAGDPLTVSIQNGALLHLGRYCVS